MNPFQGKTFYGLAPLCSDDILVAWTTPRSEINGAFSYEFTRQKAARVLAGYIKQNHNSQLLKEGWLKDFKLPWSRLSQRQRSGWSRHYNASPRLSLWPAERLPADAHPAWGDTFCVKIDWDLSDAELTRRFDCAIRTARPRPPYRKRTETTSDQLVAIAAQRIKDCRGDASIMGFIAEISNLPRAQEKLNGKTLFSKELRLDEAARRFRDQERDLSVEVLDNGWIYLEPVPHSEK